LDHPNLVNIIEAYDNPDGFYLVIEYLSGGELCEWLNNLPAKTEATICNIIKTLTDVIEYCHDKGFVLYNLKPENIMIGIEQGNPVIKVLDFGMSRLVGQGLLVSA
jgi:serine/threonine protein kinase